MSSSSTSATLEPETTPNAQFSQDIIFILDRSGSMRSLRRDVIGGVNTYVEEVRKDAKEDNLPTRLYFHSFAHDFSTEHSGVGLEEFPEFTDQHYSPAGTTALRDAVCKALDEYDEANPYDAESKNTTSVVCVINTDGDENASSRFTVEDVKNYVSAREARGNWTFVFLGSNIDAWTAGQSYGFQGANTVTMMPDAVGASYSSMATSTSRLRKNVVRGFLASDSMFNEQEVSAMASPEELENWKSRTPSP